MIATCTLEEARSCVQQYVDQILNYIDPANGITKLGFMTNEHIQELEDGGIEIEDYDSDYVTLWIEGHPVTIEAKYHETGMDVFDVVWAITE